MFDKQRTIERERATSARQQQTLKDTLDEISAVETAEAANPGAYTFALKKLYTRRDRQQAALAMTSSYIEALQGLQASKKGR